MSKKMLFVLACLLASVLTLALLQPVAVRAADEQVRYCEGCQTDVALEDWIELGGEQNETLMLTAGQHYYLIAALTGTPENGVLISGAGCIDLNGFNVTAGAGCVAISCDAGTTNLMGTGTVSGSSATTATGATIHTASAAVVNLYGGTYTKTGNNAAIYVGESCTVHMYDGVAIDTAGTFATYPTAVFMEQSKGLFHMHGGTIIGGTTTGNGGSIRVSNGSFILDDGTVTGGQASRGGNIAVNTSGKLTVNGGTITSGTATATYGGGNIYTNKRKVTINGGLITLGTAAGTSSGGGNIGIYRATVSMNGGTISNGSATNADGVGGGNVYAEGDIAVFNLSAGTVIDGQAVNGGGNICVNGGALNISGGNVSGGSLTGESQVGGGSIYLNETIATMTGGTVSNGVTDSNGGCVLVSNSSFLISNGTITGGSADRGGCVAVRNDGSLTVNGGTIASGTATATYGGGNIYTNKCTVTVNNGLITLGTAEGSSYGGGNIGAYKSTLNLHGGTVSEGSATNTSCRGGGNIYMEGDNAVLNMTAGTVTQGYIAAGYGHSIYSRSGALHFGSDAVVGSKAEDTGGSMNVYMYAGTLESAGTNAGGLYVRAGSVSITGGKYYSFYYKGSETCTITGGYFRVNYSQYVPEGYRWITVAAADAYIYQVLHESAIPVVMLVDKGGNEYYSSNPLTDYSSGKYSHAKLYGALELGDMSGRELYLDLNGNQLTVAGSGTLYAFDTANDEYDASACGTVTNNGTVQIAKDVLAPNGNRYIAVTDGTTTMHRLDMKLTGISLRTAVAGIYYRSGYHCDDVLSGLVRYYGVALSVFNMPGEDFMAEEGTDVNLYSVVEDPFQSGVAATSCLVYDILKGERTAEVNASYGEMPIYANPYIYLDLDDGMICIADTENGDKTKADKNFTGIAYSLHDMMDALDRVYYNYSETAREQLDNFYFSWVDDGMDWRFANIGKNYTSALNLVDGQGTCPVCRKTVTWTALDQQTYGETTYGTATDGTHLYLAEDITCTASGAFLTAPTAAGRVACLHLNGHKLTTTAGRTIYGDKGILNVMGIGTIAGYTGSANYAGAVQFNTTGSQGVVNLYSGTYSLADTAPAGTCVIAIRNNGGAVNVYQDAYINAGDDGKAIWTGPSNSTDSVIGLYNAKVDGDIYISGAAQSKGHISKLILENATVNGTMDVNGVNTIVLRGAPKVTLMDMESTTLLTLEELVDGADISVMANGCFTETNENATKWKKYFKAAGKEAYIEEENGALYYSTDVRTRKILVIGNSMTYYGKYVIEKGNGVFSLATRSNDPGYLYQVFRENGVNATVTNFTYGAHTLEDFYSGSCAANRGHNGHNHLEDLTDRDYDFVIFQEGSEASDAANILAECEPLMDIFLEVNPDTKFLFLVQQAVYTNNFAWQSTIHELAENGIIVADWGAMVNDVVNGVVSVPGATQSYHKFSFMVNKSKTDGRHPNVLAGYLAAQMTYCALMDESAVGKTYSFWNNANIYSAFNMDKYMSTYYAYDSTVPSNTNFREIFASEADMNGLHQLIDQYLKEKNS